MNKVKKIQNIELGNVTSKGEVIGGSPYTMHNRVSYTYDGVFYEWLIGDAFEWFDFDDNKMVDDAIENIQYIEGQIVVIPRDTGRLDLIDLHNH